MNKKLIAVAVAGVFAAPAVAMAQGTSVTLYGTAYATYELVKEDSSTSPLVGPLNPTNLAVVNGTGHGTLNGINVSRRDRVTAGNSSNLGARVREDLGGGLAAWGQCEMDMNLDGGSAAAGAVCTRNAGLGLEGGFGNFFLGGWDTPYKTLTTSGKIDPFYATGIAYLAAIIGTPGAGSATSISKANSAAIATTNSSGFERRQADSIQYWTPNWSGFQAKLAYSAGEGKGADNAPSTALVTTPILKPRIWSANLIYDNGPIYIGVGYEEHKDYLGLAGIDGARSLGNTTGSKDQGLKIAGSYTFGNFMVAAVWEKLKLENDLAITAPATTLRDLERDAWALVAQYKGGAWRVYGAYGQADDADCTRNNALASPCSGNDTGAKYWALGGGYFLSKRTELIANYVMVDNDQFGGYTFGSGAVTGVAVPGGQGAGPAGVGTDAQGFQVGVRHTF